MSDSKKPPKPAANPSNHAVPLDWALVSRALASFALHRIYLFGPPGVGKTFCAYHDGRIGNGVYAITLTTDTPASELRGNYMPRGGEFVWVDGPVVRAMREGARLVINELLHAADDVFSFLHPILEQPATARITLPTGETVFPATGFNVIATDNGPPEALPPALRDRFDAVLEIREPHPNALSLLSPDLRELARRSFALDEERRVSLRGWLRLDELRREFGLENACLLAFGTERGGQIHDAILLAQEEFSQEELF
jgi:MoxR-like ATPase